MGLLGIDAIDIYYDESHIIHDLSINVEEDEACALLGRNGTDKTTVLRCIAGATPPEVREGTTRSKDDDITDVPTEDVSVRGVSLVPEERRVFPNLSVAENPRLTEIVNNKSNTFGRSLSFGHKGISTEEVYGRFPRLDEWRGQCTETLSDGEQQMLAIAHALKQSTDLLPLDEPYKGLTPEIIEDVEDTVKRISNVGTTTLLVEQNTTAAIKLVDRVYVIDQGSTTFDGTAEELHDDDEIREWYLGV